MFKKLVYSVIPALTLALVAVTDMATSTSTFLYHGEPDCPKELFK